MRITVLLFLFACIVFSCQEDENSPAYIYAKTSTNQSVYVGEDTSDPAVVQVLNKNRIPVRNVNVSFKVVTGKLRVENANILTDANGIAFTHVHVDSDGQSLSVLEASVSGVKTTANFTFNISSGHASKIVIKDGNNQEGRAGAFVAQPLKVRVSDDFDIAAKQVPVQFVVTEGNGTPGQQIVYTNDEGEAVVDFTLANNDTDNTIIASCNDHAVTFNLSSVFPSQIYLSKTDEGIKIEWDKSMIVNFNKYVIYKASSRAMDFLPMKTITDQETITFVDNTVVPGETYYYYIAIETDKGTLVAGDAKFLEFGDVFLTDGAVNDMVVDKSRNRLYLSMPSLNEIHVVDITTQQLIDKWYVGSHPNGMELSRDNKILYVALSGSGDVAFIDLDSKQIKKIDVETALDDEKVFDVLEGAPGCVFVTGSPNEYGIAYVSVIKTDQNDKVERLANVIIRFSPYMQADYGKTLYVGSFQYLYRFDPYNNPSTYIEPIYQFSSSRSQFSLSPAGDKLYFSKEVLNSKSLAIVHSDFDGWPVVNADGSEVYYLSNNSITGYDTDNYATIKEIKLYTSYQMEMIKMSKDDKMFFVLASNGWQVDGKYTIIFVKNK